MSPLYFRAEIAPNEFLPIFFVSVLVLLFGVAYAGWITLTKMGYMPKKWLNFGYIFWGLQTYSLYELAILIHSNHFTIKVLLVTMIAYLFIPHLYFYLVSESDRRYNPKKEADNGK